MESAVLSTLMFLKIVIFSFKELTQSKGGDTVKGSSGDRTVFKKVSIFFLYRVCRIVLSKNLTFKVVLRSHLT